MDILPPIRPKEPPTQPSQPEPEGPSWPMMFVLFLLAGGIWLWVKGYEATRHPAVDYSVFYEWVETGKVKSVVLADSTVQGELLAPEMVAGHQTQSFQSAIPDNDVALLPLLRERKVILRVDNAGSVLLQIVLALLPWVVLIGVWLWASRRTKTMMIGGGPLEGMLKSKGRRFDKKTAVNVTFEDVAGLTAAKRDLQEVVQFLRQPERFQRLGGKVPRGVLLVGPPGTGKTLLARAVAGESGVPFFSITASEFIELFVGVGAARVRDLFEEAKKSAPAIVFIDELDAVGRSRGAGIGSGHDEREQTLNQLLSEMDGFGRNDLVIVLSATNRPDVLDPALLRPGRFDRHVIVDRPELAARRAILGVHVKNKPLARDVDLDDLAKRTPGFSGADLANLVNEAALHATRQGAESIGASDFAEAYDKIVLGDPREGKLGPEERQRIAVHESGHAVVAQFSKDSQLPQRVTIIPRGLTLGATQQMPGHDRHLETETELQARLRVLLGGYAAEGLVLGEVSTGAENDLKEATRLASKMVAHYGMSKALGPVYFEHDVEHPFLGQRIATEGGTSDATLHGIEREMREILSQALHGAAELLKEHRSDLDRLSRALLEKETLEATELAGLLGACPDPAPAIAAAVSLRR
jgi:cell division protease FtsH